VTGQTIFADYVPVNSTGVAPFEITIVYVDGDEEYTRKFNQDIPVSRNALTTLKGAFFTANSEIKVEVKDAFEGQIPGNEKEQLIIAAAMGGEVTLTDNVELDAPINVQANMTINLNGKSISYSPVRGVGVINVAEGASLKVIGGTISSTAENGGSAILNKGTLEIEDATLNGAPSNTATGTASYALNSDGANSKLVVKNSTINGRGAIGATNGTQVEINGGTYHTPAVAWGHAIYADGEGTQVTINGGTFSEGYESNANNWGMYQIYSGNKAKVIVNDGTFEPWDCANGYDLCTATEGTIAIYGGTFAENPSSQNGKNYVAAGYKAIEKDGKWVVVATANDAASLATAVAKGGVIVLEGDIALDETIVIPTGVTATLDLNGKTITASTTDGFTVNTGANLTISGNGKVESNGAPIRAIGGKVIVNGGEFTQTGAWNTNVSTYRYSVDSREGGEIIIKGGIFKTNNGMINVSANSSVVVEGGNFEFNNNTGGTRHFAYVSGDLTINDGEFKGVADASAGGCFFCGAAVTANVTVNGGKFTSLWSSGTVNKFFEVYYGGSIDVKGGLFNTNGGIESFVEANTDDATKDAYPYRAK